MPNPKTGTVTIDVARAVQGSKSRQSGVPHRQNRSCACTVGKISFTPDKLIDNATTLISSVIKAKRRFAKRQVIKGCY